MTYWREISSAVMFLLIGAGVWGGQPEALGIDHDPLECVTAGEFPFVEAQVTGSASSTVESARVYFKLAREPEWYYLEMTPLDASSFHAALPKPLESAGRIDYYVSMVRSDFDATRTEELDFDVVAGGCSARPAPAAVAAGLVIRGTAANQAAIPVGFAADAIESFVATSGQVVSGSALTGAGAGGAGISAATLGIIGGGAAAAGVGIAVASGGGDEPTLTLPTPPPTATTPMVMTPAPTPAPVNPLSGGWDVTDTVRESCDPMDVGGMRTTRATFTQTGAMLTIELTGPTVFGTLTGTVAGSDFTATGQVVDEGEAATTRVTGTFDGTNNINGTFEELFTEDDCEVTGVFSGVRR